MTDFSVQRARVPLLSFDEKCFQLYDGDWGDQKAPRLRTANSEHEVKSKVSGKHSIVVKKIKESDKQQRTE
jgi:hypothetical protein